MGVGRTGLVTRALSLVDIALWDVQGQRTGLPLYRLLGGHRDTVPVMVVAGYPQDPADVDDIVTTAVSAAAQGHRLVKIARAADPAVTAAILTRLAEALPATTRVVVDASWVWERPDEAMAEIQTWQDAPVAWVEDPFQPEDARAYRVLRARSPIPIGVGDEVGDPFVFERLAEVDGMDVLRLDVVTIGGVTPAMRVAHRAEAWGLPVSMHISPEVSAHLAAALPGVANVETFVRSGNPYDPSHELCDGGPEFAAGHARLSSRPGLGYHVTSTSR
jgi:L-alanine-DL-glutamate epimerase-like enolase superfamily enzyme